MAAVDLQHPRVSLGTRTATSTSHSLAVAKNKAKGQECVSQSARAHRCESLPP